MQEPVVQDHAMKAHPMALGEHVEFADSHRLVAVARELARHCNRIIPGHPILIADPTV